jgi:hypothetical protein
MAYGNWDDIIEQYNWLISDVGNPKNNLHKQFSTNAHAMLELIPQIRGLPEFSDVISITSHFTLFVTFADKHTGLYIMYEYEEDQYRVHFYQGDIGE